jgi:hypothetical protein
MCCGVEKYFAKPTPKMKAPYPCNVTTKNVKKILE